MPKFKKKKFQGQDYDMVHLDDFLIQITEGTDTYQVLVSFRCHCFTEEFKAHHTPGHLYVHAGEKRAFCTIRHGLSLNLPGYMTSLAGKAVYLSNKGNFFFMRHNGGNYLVVFNAKRVQGKPYAVLIDVVTAHPRPTFIQYAQPVTFNKLVAASATGNPVPAGPSSRIKRG